MVVADEVPIPVVCTNVVLTTVEPLEKTVHVKTINATSYDMIMPDGFVPTVYVYRLADSSDVVYEKAVSRIKDGLRKVLVPYFPWAGRWIAVPEGTRRRLLCNDEGIPFIEAYVDQNLDSVVGMSSDFKPVPELQGHSTLGMDPMLYTHPMVPEGLPCVFVQVTRFKCGGLVVATTFNHTHTDGTSYCDFMTAWSDFSRTGKTDMIVDANRGAIEVSSRASIPDSIFYSPPSKVWDSISYEVSSSSIKSLKKEVKQGRDGAYVSTLDCITAHLWKTLASLPFSITSGKEIGMLSTVGGRSKFFDPPLPNLLGNVISAMRMPNVPTAELVKMPVSGIASKIREKFLSTTRDKWLSDERVAETMDAMANDGIMAWALNSWQTFPTYKVDFGFGTPIFAPGSNTDATLDIPGICYVGPPTPGVSSSAAWIVLRSTPEILKAIEEDQHFLSFFLPKSKNLFKDKLY